MANFYIYLYQTVNYRQLNNRFDLPIFIISTIWWVSKENHSISVFTYKVTL